MSTVEASEFGAKLEVAINTCDKAVLAQLIDIERIVRRAIAQSNLPTKVKTSVFRDEGRTLSESILVNICPKNFSYDASVSYLRTLRIRGGDFVIMRTTYLGRIVYVGYAVGMTADDKVIADDVYLYNYHLHHTELLSQLLQLSSENHDRREELYEVFALLRAKDPASGLIALANETTKVRSSLLFSVLRLQAQAEIVT